MNNPAKNIYFLNYIFTGYSMLSLQLICPWNALYTRKGNNFQGFGLGYKFESKVRSSLRPAH